MATTIIAVAVARTAMAATAAAVAVARTAMAATAAAVAVARTAMAATATANCQGYLRSSDKAVPYGLKVAEGLRCTVKRRGFLVAQLVRVARDSVVGEATFGIGAAR